eukprot:5914372-Karenia_brevis.AAC.1
MQAALHPYSGSAVKGDGNAKLAKRIWHVTVDENGQKVRALLSNVHAWTGIDGALLKPVAALATEDLPD